MNNKIDFEKLFEEKKDADYIVSYLNILTSVEKSIILILNSKGTALNSKQIQDEFVINVVNFLRRYFQGISNLGDTMDESFEDRVKLLPYWDFTSDDICLLNSEFDSLSVEEEKPKEKNIKHPVLDTSQKGINFYKKKLSKMNISLPSFEKINSDLENLNEMNLVLKREVSDKKTKGLWYLNPTIHFCLKKTEINMYKEYSPKKEE
jgi:hypothetical protein|tara:strand:+ start:315 stop:932 length:618 start_codon:yes stop_codon:yes gene_type:complete